MLDFKEKIEKLLEKRRDEITANSKQGKKFVTYVSQHVPLELLEASGLDYMSWDWYITLYGTPQEYNDKKVPDLYFPTDWCVYSRSNFALEINNPKPRVDLAIVTYTCDPITKMWEYLEKDYNLFYYNLPRSINDASIAYWYDTTKLLKDELEKLSENSITDKQLEEAIAKESEIRNLLGELRTSIFFKDDLLLNSSDILKIHSLKSCLGQDAYMTVLLEAKKMIGEVPENMESTKPCFYLMGPLFLEPSPNAIWHDTLDGVELVEEIESMGYKTIDESWSNYLVGKSYKSKKGEEPLKFIARNSYLRPHHASMSANEEKVGEHLEMINKYKLKGALYYNYNGCTLFLMESRLTEYMFDSDAIAYKHIQISGWKDELANILDQSEAFILSNS
jgi:benzoyl-CoA reductase/2-hydroxyglutaryl-CoA dehydratase subunit BcrC/BadD/HgdB